MGDEIAATRFRQTNFARFERRFAEEMALLRRCFEERGFSDRAAVGGLELEAWLVDERGMPCPENDALLERLAMPAVVHELSRFNIEFNVAPQPLGDAGIGRLEAELAETWARSEEVASELGLGVVAIGTLPSVTDRMLCPANMSGLNRYKALNEQVLRLRRGTPIVLDIVGRDHLHSEHTDVMLEAAATSFQVHLQVPLARAVRYYNAAVIASAPLVAMAANSPYLFGRSLWDESRIPLFEQAINVGSPVRRVTFGTGYANESLIELFGENEALYPVLLPLELDLPVEQFAHVRLHNGTIWRWNRPLIGFDPDGHPHLRIEQRVMAAGPTCIDMAANMAFFFGVAEMLATDGVVPESRLPFLQARDNFYESARLGVNATVTWLDGERMRLRRLLLGELLPLARRGLEQLGVDAALASRYLGIVERRVSEQRTGADWQRAFVGRYGDDMAQLTRAYRERQTSGLPVHLWDL